MLVVARADRAAEPVHRVPAAVEDPVVGGRPVVVELVAAVADALAVPPADGAEVERLGDQHVVVDRDDVAARSRAAAGDRRSWRAGPCAPAPGPRRSAPRRRCGARRSARTAARPRGWRRRAGRRRACRGRGSRRRCGPRRRRGRWGSGPRRCIGLAVEDRDVVPEARQRLALLLDPRLLVGVGEREQLAGGLEVAVDAVGGEIGLQAVEVLEREAFEGRHLLREAREPVLDAVGERGDGEPAVAPARAEACRLGFEQDDFSLWSVLLCVKCSPETGEAAADDAEVGVDPAGQRRAPARPVPAARTAAARRRGRPRGAPRWAATQARACASRSRSASPRWRPTSWRPIGSSSRVTPAGTASAGCDVTVIRLQERNHSR